MKQKQWAIYTVLTALIIAGVLSCKKTIQPEAQPQDLITEFKVVNMKDTMIYGAVDNDANTITVYIPYYYNLAVIQPDITVSDNATLVGQIQPVDINDSTQTYTVKAASGSARTYKLHIIIQDVSYDDLALQWSNEPAIAYPGESFGYVLGDFKTTDTTGLKVTLTNTVTDATINTQNNTIITSSITGYRSFGLIFYPPQDADSGTYKTTVTFKGVNAMLPSPLHIDYRVPQVSTVWDPQTVTPGDSIQFLALSLFIDLKSVTLTLNGKIYGMPISSYTRKSAYIEIPDDLPVGSWGMVNFVFQFGDWPAQNVPVALTVNAKS